MENIVSKKTTYILMMIGATIILLLRLYLDYDNIQAVKFYFTKQINRSVEFDTKGKGMFLVDKYIRLDIYCNNFEYCSRFDNNKNLEVKILPSNSKTKLKIKKEKNSNLFITIINDTCYQFRVYADPGVFGKLFE